MSSLATEASHVIFC